MQPETMFVINMICIIVLFGALCVNMFFVFHTHSKVNKHAARLDNTDAYIKQINEDMSIALSKLEDGVKYHLDASSVSILDLAEFKNLDPYIKNLYKKHIVDVLFPAIMDGIKKTMKDEKYYDFLQQHEQEIADTIYDLAKRIKYNGIDSITQ